MWRLAGKVPIGLRCRPENPSFDLVFTFGHRCVTTVGYADDSSEDYGGVALAVIAVRTIGGQSCSTAGADDVGRTFGLDTQLARPYKEQLFRSLRVRRGYILATGLQSPFPEFGSANVGAPHVEASVAAVSVAPRFNWRGWLMHGRGSSCTLSECDEVRSEGAGELVYGDETGVGSSLLDQGEVASAHTCALSEARRGHTGDLTPRADMLAEACHEFDSLSETQVIVCGHSRRFVVARNRNEHSCTHLDR